MLVWYSGALAPHPPNDGDPRAALLACAFVYLGYSTLQGPSSVMIRPHPTVWRSWHGLCTLYLLVLVYMLIIGKDASRQLLTVRCALPPCHVMATCWAALRMGAQVCTSCCMLHAGSTNVACACRVLRGSSPCLACIAC